MRHVAPLSSDGVIDAIVVPTYRAVDHLAKVADLAAELSCPLLTLHSGKETSAERAARILPADLDLIAIDVHDPGLVSFPLLKTSRILEGSNFTRQSDLSLKRNVALVLGRMLGWSRIFFLDDDITSVSPAAVRRAGGLLNSYNAVGFDVTGFFDNSVVCHAYRDSGGPQKSFIGAGALVVDIRACDSFFPDIYNDDWFFLIDENQQLQRVTTVGRVRQARYDPYEDLERARSEEFGDTLAEGLFWLLDQGKTIMDADREHWANFLKRRENFIKTVIERVQSGNLAASEKKRRIAALGISMRQLRHITPEDCEKYLGAWLADRETWRRYIRALPSPVKAAEALQEMGLLTYRLGGSMSPQAQD